MIVVASVHHTGTNFVFQHLLNGMRQVGMGHYRYVDEPMPAKSFTRIHCDMDQSGFLEWWLLRCECVVPMRHPVSVAESWKARGKDLANLARQWSTLKTQVEPYEPSYLPLDVEDKEKWLTEFNEKTGLNIHTQWPVVMSCNKSATLTETERAAVVEVMDDGFFDRFGYED
jgi:hypothetical protein